MACPAVYCASFVDMYTHLRNIALHLFIIQRVDFVVPTVEVHLLVARAWCVCV